MKWSTLREFLEVGLLVSASVLTVTAYQLRPREFDGQYLTMLPASAAALLFVCLIFSVASFLRPTTNGRKKRLLFLCFVLSFIELPFAVFSLLYYVTAYNSRLMAL
jgi:hypothetical protein